MAKSKLWIFDGMQKHRRSILTTKLLKLPTEWLIILSRVSMTAPFLSLFLVRPGIFEEHMAVCIMTVYFENNEINFVFQQCIMRIHGQKVFNGWLQQLANKNLSLIHIALQKIWCHHAKRLHYHSHSIWHITYES